MPAVALAAWQFVRVLDWTLSNGFADLPIFLATALRFLGGGPLYDISGSPTETFAPGAAVFKFPPVHLVPFVPLLVAVGWSPAVFPGIFWLHVIRYVLVMAACTALVVPRRNPICTALIGIVFLSFAPFAESLYGLTFENLLLALLTIAMACLPTRRSWPGAVCLAYAAMAKVFPSPMLVYYVVRRQWRQLLQCGLAALAFLVLGILVFGVAEHRKYFAVILPILLQETVEEGILNLSLAPLLQRLGVPFAPYRIALLLASMWILHVSSRRDPSSALGMRLAFSFVICLMLLLMPNCWGQYHLVLLLPIAVLLGSAWDPESPIKGLGALIALAAWAPMIASYNYLDCPGPSAEWLIQLRQFSPILLWIATGGLLIASQLRAEPQSDAKGTPA